MFKNTQILFVFFFLFVKTLFAQVSNLDDYFKTKNIAPKSEQELYYSIEKQGNGAIPKRGDYVKIKYVGKLLDGTVFDESQNEPFVFRLGYRQVIQGWEIGVPLFKVGTKGTLYLPPSLAYGARAKGKIPANSYLIFEVEIQQILNDAEYEKYNSDLEKREMAAFQNQKLKQQSKDDAIIKEFAASKNIKISAGLSNLSYAITKKGKGANAKDGDLISVEYEGFLPDGTPFDDNKNRKVFQFVLGAKKVLEGWDIGFKYFSKGSEGYLMIPSMLAYKGTAIPEKNIPAFSVLIFKIKVKDIN
jgi:FKBP-type peptidyl-prolyl cis-trans isomerase FkpA